MTSDGAAVYYRCSSCKRNVRDDEVHNIQELGVIFCPHCAKDMQTLQRIAEGLRTLPDTPGQKL